MITFNGTKKDWLYLLKGIEKAPFAPIDRNVIKIPGMDGGYLSSSNVDIMTISLPVGFKIDDDAHALELRDELAEWLLVDEPSPLELPDEEGRHYYAVVQNTMDDFEKFARFCRGTLEFLCVDPYSYGPQETHTFIESTTIINKGTADALPIIELRPSTDTTFVAIQSDNHQKIIEGEEYPVYTMIGQPLEVEDTPFQEYERVFYSNAESTTGWTTAGNGDIDGGVVGGSIVSVGSRFRADSYGEGSAWHGPAIKHSLSEPLQDFRVSTYIGFLNKSKAAMVGRIEVYLLDVNGESVCKMALKDTSAAKANVYAEMRMGDKNDGEYVVHDHGNYEGTWNNFSGRMWIERRWDEDKEENEWSFWLGHRDGDIFVKRRIRRGVRDGGKYDKKVAQVVIHIATVGEHTPIHESSGVSSVIVDKINKEPEKIPYIAGEGDVIRLDTRKGNAYINGEPADDLLDFGGDFIKLVKGQNRLATLPNNVETTVKYEPRNR